MSQGRGAQSTEIPQASPAPPLLVVLSGPSGAGKDAALAELKKLDRPWHFALTATTRPPRQGEEAGVDYIFLDDDAFHRMRERDELLEFAQVYDRWYGVPRGQVRDALKMGKDVILKVDVQGAATVRSLAPEAVTIFIMPKSLDELRQRLAGRMTETSPEMEVRLNAARDELAQMNSFDYRVVNPQGSLLQAVADIDAIIAAEKCRVSPRVVQLL